MYSIRYVIEIVLNESIYTSVHYLKGSKKMQKNQISTNTKEKQLHSE